MNENVSTASADKLGRLHKLLQADPTNASLRRQCVDLATQAGQYEVVVQLADSALADLEILRIIEVPNQ